MHSTPGFDHLEFSPPRGFRRLTAQDLNDWAVLQAGSEVSYAYRLAGREVRSYIQKEVDGLSLAQVGAAPRRQRCAERSGRLRHRAESLRL